MSPTPIRNAKAFTLIELIGVTVVVVVLLVFIIPRPNRSHSNAPRITCVNNLKEIGLAYLVWANDHNDRFPASDSASDGGWIESLTSADQGFRCWTNYAIMANELGQVPKLLICPADKRKPANTWPNFANTNLSYFVGVSADEKHPQSQLAGDRNLGAGTKSDRNFGFSPESGQGNDVAIQTNSQDGPVSWSLKMHSRGNSDGAGNIMLADGSAQQVTSVNFRANWQPPGGLTTNWPAGH